MLREDIVDRSDGNLEWAAARVGCHRRVDRPGTPSRIDVIEQRVARAVTNGGLQGRHIPKPVQFHIALETPKSNRVRLDGEDVASVAQAARRSHGDETDAGPNVEDRAGGDPIEQRHQARLEGAIGAEKRRSRSRRALENAGRAANAVRAQVPAGVRKGASEALREDADGKAGSNHESSRDRDFVREAVSVAKAAKRGADEAEAINQRDDRSLGVSLLRSPRADGTIARSWPFMRLPAASFTVAPASLVGATDRGLGGIGGTG